MPAKKSKRDAKDKGGVVAAVTKQGGLKFPNGSAAGTASDSSSPTIQSPEINPIATPSSNGIPTISPQLDAITGTSFAPVPASRTLNEWNRGSPALAGSPGNLISIMGESPPTLPSSYEDPRSLQGWPSPRLPGNNPPISASPPTHGRRPLSFQMDQPYQPYQPSEAVSHAPSHTYRRSSLHSHIAQSRASPNPPLPHQPQAHFYGTPDLNFNVQSQNGLKAGERGYHFGFDTLPQQHVGNAPGTDQVVTAGYEGGLEVYSVSKRGLDPLASLKGLRGGVFGAKILPKLAGGRADQGPFVVVIVHGPVVQQPASDLQNQGDGFYDRGSSPPPPPDMLARDAALAKNALPVEFYQTSVDVYSLKTNERVATLLEAPKIQLKMPVTSPIFQAPPPTGAFNIKADGNSILVASGATGECWIYRQLVNPTDSVIQFRCAAKLWTTLQQPLSRDQVPDSDRTRPEMWRPSPRSPIVALRGKWVAYCPANPSSQMALRASVGVPVLGKGPGLASMTPPQLPTVNVELDIPAGESMINKLVRDAAQELISGGTWAVHHGWQALNNYWKGTPAASAPRSPPLQPQSWTTGYSAGRQDGGQFPPTHGSAPPPIVKDPGLVSVVSIETLPNSAAVHQMATFAIPLGCSFLSFSPSALSLLTVSTKGDVQSVWDLMRMHYTKGSALHLSASSLGTPTGPRVRHLAQFSRMTVARIVAIAWTRPNGERLSMVTERGTVHVFEMPTSAFAWPPPRRRIHQQEATAAASGGQSAGPAASYALTKSKLNAALDAARPLLPRPRRSSTNASQSTGASIVDHASMGGKMLAAGISHSLGKTGSAIVNLRNVGENRKTLPSSSFPPGPGSVVWLSGKRLHSLFVLGDGLVRLFPTKTRPPASGSNKGRVMRLGRAVEFKVPYLPDDLLASAVKRFLDPEEYLDLTDQNDNNTLVLDNRSRPPPTVQILEVSSIPQAEIESSAPYQPFHTDRRVALFERQAAAGKSSGKAFLDDMTSQLEGTSLGDTPVPTPPRRKQGKKVEPASGLIDSPDGAWAFGQVIHAAQVDTGQHRLSEDDTFSMNTEDSRALPPSAMERVLQHTEEGEQIVITTRRRRNGGRGTADQDEEGFFEDDCEVLDFADQRV